VSTAATTAIPRVPVHLPEGKLCADDEVDITDRPHGVAINTVARAVLLLERAA
jgi:hypothetical protein